MVAFVVKIIFWLISLPIVPVRLRILLLKFMGCNISQGAYISHSVFVGSRNVSVGKFCVINVFTFLDGAGELILGDYVRVGPHAKFLTGTHDIMPSTIRRDPDNRKNLRTVIERGCWIGMGAQVLAGVTVAEGCVIAAGAVVTIDTAPNGLYGGVPARRLKDLPVIVECEQDILSKFNRWEK